MVNYKDLKDLGKAWAKEYCQALNESEAYKEAARGWGIDFDGGMLFVMEASGEIEDNVSAFLDLKDGDCLKIVVLGPDEEPPREPTLTLKGSFLMWRKLAFKKADPIQSIMQGDLQLEGESSLAMKYARAAMELANVVEKTDTTLFTKYDLGGNE
ncbi:MAG: SCP2 sterol-binding domain-containing protein [Promethearchaeia archaeon]